MKLKQTLILSGLLLAAAAQAVFFAFAWYCLYSNYQHQKEHR